MPSPLRGKTAAGVIGVFPSNFVELIGANTSGAATANTGGGAVAINADYRALYDYDAEDETELTIREGDILHVESETVTLTLTLTSVSVSVTLIITFALAYLSSPSLSL